MESLGMVAAFPVVSNVAGATIRMVMLDNRVLQVIGWSVDLGNGSQRRELQQDGTPRLVCVLTFGSS